MIWCILRDAILQKVVYFKNESGTGVVFLALCMYLMVIIDNSLLFCLYIFVLEDLVFFPTVNYKCPNFLWEQNFVKLDMCAMPHTSRRMFFPSCTFLSSHLLFCRFTPHFAISTRTTFHTLFIHRRQMWQKRNSMKGEEFNKDRAFCNGLLYLGVVLKLRWQKEVDMWFVKCQRH